jgi:SET domain-containing protein
MNRTLGAENRSAIVALKHIAQGEEFTYNYNFEVDWEAGEEQVLYGLFITSM